MQPTQQPVQTKQAPVQKPVQTTQQKPGVGTTTQPAGSGQPVQQGQQVQKKPSKWWIWVLIAVVVVAGGIWAYFQFLR